MSEVVRPYLWLAAAAFVVGFLSYLLMGPPSAAFASDEPRWTAPVSAPVSAEWNIPRRI